MDKKIFSKVLAVMLIITLTFANLIFLAVYAGRTYAANVNYEQQGTEINKTNVSFDAYFISEEGNKTHTQVTEMNKSELKLFLSVSVTQGYLKDAVVSIGNSNFKLVQREELPVGVEAIDTEKGTVTLNQINRGENIEIALPIEVVKDERFSLDNFSKDAEVNLKGTYINNSAKEIKAEKTVIVNLSLSEEATSNLSARIYKYSIFEENERKKALLQISISSKVENNLLPVKSTKIDMQVPTLFGLMPENVDVISSSTRATNGEGGTAFNSDNYTYADGIISLTVLNNPDENSAVSWVKNSADEYIINLVYALEDAQIEINEETSKIELTANSKLSLYNNEAKEIENEITGELKLPEASKSVVSYEINNKTNEIAKGYMLVANSANTEYKQEIKVNIGHNPTVNNIEINKNTEYYTDENENTYPATTYYKSISIDRENLVKILGENAEVIIISDGVNLATLNKDITTYKFEQEISNIMILASAPVANGILTIETEKYIKSAEYNEQIISKINKLTTSITGKATLIPEEASTEVALVQPTLQISSSLDRKKLSTVIENKDVEIRAVLKTNNSTNRLFKNPVIEIELPKYVEEIKVNTIDIWYNDELKAGSGNVTTNAEGKKVIRIELLGEQTKFSDILSTEGTTLIIGADIKVEKTAPSITEKMNVKVINNNQETVETSSNITYMAPTGMITLNSISGYNDKQEEITSISGEEETGKLDIAAKSKIATEKITIINNYDYTCGDISILGRTPTEGNKSLSTQKDLGSTFTAKMVSGITPVEGTEAGNISIYYSQNENATKDLNDSNNGWTKDRTTLENVGSYLILADTAMENGDTMEFSYDIEIPENLSRDQSTSSEYQVAYTSLEGTLKGSREAVTSPIAALSTGSGPELKVELLADVENGQQVKEGQLIEYTIKVTNIGKSDVNNIEVEAEIPQGSYYTRKEMDSTREIYVEDNTVKKHTETIENLAIGESKESKFLLTVGSRRQAEDYINRENYDTEEKYQKVLEQYREKHPDSTEVEIVATAKTNDNDETLTFTSNKIANEKIKAYFKLKLDRYTATLEEGIKVEYDLVIKKFDLNDLNNVEIICQIPDGLTYDSALYNEENITPEITDSQIKWKIDKLTSGYIIRMTFIIDEITGDKEISLKAQGTCNEYEGTIESNTETFTVGIPKLEISHSSSNTTEEVTEGDEIVYTIKVKNISAVGAYDVKITDYLTEGLSLKSLKYTLGQKTDTYQLSGTSYTFKINIPANETLTMELTARANELKDEETSKTVSNRFEVEANKVDKLSSTEITHDVKKKVYTVDDNNEVVESNSLSGLVWLDKNSNGIREEGEERLAQVPVILVNESGKTVASSITDEKGEYIFNNLVQGKYIVVFLYDMANYDVTIYGKEGSTTNSDAVTMNVNIEDISTPCAATNTIDLTSNMYNIDLGLKINPKFDLSLTKTISKITVQSSKGTTTKTYNKSTLEKIEIPSKQILGSTVAVEYTITVTNTGAIPGYASRIIDYLSNTDLKFNSETNADWYLGTDGNLYNSSLSDKLLKPGESLELKLVLTKNITENNIGITSNIAEIYEAYNDEGIEDYNSTPANKAQNENDLGQADIIVGIKTGVVMYLGLTIILVSIMLVGIYVLNKKVIKRI